MYKAVRKNDNPAPGAYDTTHIVTSKDRKPRAQGFSTLARVLHCPVLNPETDPGQYDPAHMRGDTPNRVAADLKRGGDSERVPLNKNRLIAPPPGAYEVRELNPKRVKGFGFSSSTENRFGDDLGKAGSQILTKLHSTSHSPPGGAARMSAARMSSSSAVTAGGAGGSSELATPGAVAVPVSTKRTQRLVTKELVAPKDSKLANPTREVDREKDHVVASEHGSSLGRGDGRGRGGRGGISTTRRGAGAAKDSGPEPGVAAGAGAGSGAARAKPTQKQQGTLPSG